MKNVGNNLSCKNEIKKQYKPKNYVRKSGLSLIHMTVRINEMSRMTFKVSYVEMFIDYLLILIIWRPQSPSGITPIIYYVELTHLGLEASI